MAAYKKIYIFIYIFSLSPRHQLFSSPVLNSLTKDLQVNGMYSISGETQKQFIMYIFFHHHVFLLAPCKTFINIHINEKTKIIKWIKKNRNEKWEYAIYENTFDKSGFQSLSVPKHPVSYSLCYVSETVSNVLDQR